MQSARLPSTTVHDARRMLCPARALLVASTLLCALPPAAGAQADPAPPVPLLPSVSVGDVVAREVNGVEVSADFPVTLSAPMPVPVTVSYATREGDALAPADFTATSGTLTFMPGETRRAVPVGITDDRAGENAERFTFVLSDPVGASLSRATGSGTIVDDDALPVRRVPSITMTLKRTLTGGTLVRGRVVPPAGALVTGCAAAQVSVIVARGERMLAREVFDLDPNCAYRVHLERPPSRSQVFARFDGSQQLRPISTRRASLRP
jgi:hypothetical protein